MTKFRAFAFGLLLALCFGAWAQTYGPAIFTTRLTVNPGPLTVGGFDVCLENGTNCGLTETSGNGTVLETSGCSNAIGMPYEYRKIGTVVTMAVNIASCTSSGTAQIVFESLPADLRPLTSLRMAVSPFTCNGVATTAYLSVGSSGAVAANLATTCAAASTITASSSFLVISYSTAFDGLGPG